MEEKDHISSDRDSATSSDVKKAWGVKHEESGASGNHGNAYDSVGDLKSSIEYNNRYLKIAKELGNKQWEGKAYSNLGKVYRNLGDIIKAINYHNQHLKIT